MYGQNKLWWGHNYDSLRQVSLVKEVKKKKWVIRKKKLYWFFELKKKDFIVLQVFFNDFQ